MSEVSAGSLIDAGAARALLEPLTDLVALASVAILEVTKITAEDKPDGSPVTQADLAADRIIVEGLNKLRPNIPVVSEERADAATGPYLQSFFIVDPLDGTREFIAGHNDYTVNVALVTEGRPLLGVIAAPALGLLWRGVVGFGAERMKVTLDGAIRQASRTPVHTKARSDSAWIAAISRSHLDNRTDAFIRQRKGATRLTIGSALKFCRVAEGAADLYPRLAPTCEWDVAAGHAMLTAAGGMITTPEGAPLPYGRIAEQFRIPAFVAWGDPSTPARLGLSK
jgi:3'(2'), 5'-bisphosphate nucleotidase